MNTRIYKPNSENTKVVDENSSVTALAAEVILTWIACNHALEALPDEEFEAPDFCDPLYLRVEWLTAAEATTAQELSAKAKALYTIAPNPHEVRQDEAFAMLELSILRDLREITRVDAPDFTGLSAQDAEEVVKAFVNGNDSDCSDCRGTGWRVWSDGSEHFRERCTCGAPDSFDDAEYAGTA
jgi:hypothetical protein